MNSAISPHDRRRFLAILLEHEVEVEPDSIERHLRFAAELNVATAYCDRLPTSARRRVSPELLGRIEEISLEAAARNTLLLAEAAQIGKKLDEHNIMHVFIKGVALLATAYDRISSRSMSDLDLWVRPSDIDRVRRLLLDEGFNDTEGDHQTPDGGSLRDFRRPSDHEDVPLVSPDGTVLDVHRFIPDVEPIGPFDLDEVFGRASQIAVPGGAVRVPSRADTMAHICVHVMQHHLGGRTLVTRHLLDVAALLAAGGENALAPLRRSPAAVSVALSLRLLAAARAARPSALDDLLVAIAAPDSSAAARIDWLQSTALLARRLASDVRHDPSRFWNRVVPARSWMARAYGVSEQSPLIPALYVWRVLSWPVPAWRREAR